MSIIVLLVVVFMPTLLAKSISIVLNAIITALKDLLAFANTLNK